MAYWLASHLLMPWLRRRINRIIGRERIPNAGPLLIVANHNSWIDPALIISAVYPVLKRKIHFIAASRKYRALGGLPIDRTNKARVVDTAAEILKTGGVVGVFPEGNANAAGEIRKAHTGAARLALRSGAKILPIGVRNTNGVQPLAAIRSCLSEKNIELDIGSPFQYRGKNPDEITYEKLQDVTTDIVKQLAILSGKQNNHGLSNSPSHPSALDSPSP